MVLFLYLYCLPYHIPPVYHLPAAIWILPTDVVLCRSLFVPTVHHYRSCVLLPCNFVSPPPLLLLVIYHHPLPAHTQFLLLPTIFPRLFCAYACNTACYLPPLEKFTCLLPFTCTPTRTTHILPPRTLLQRDSSAFPSHLPIVPVRSTPTDRNFYHVSYTYHALFYRLLLVDLTCLPMVLDCGRRPTLDLGVTTSCLCYLPATTYLPFYPSVGGLTFCIWDSSLHFHRLYHYFLPCIPTPTIFLPVPYFPQTVLYFTTYLGSRSPYHSHHTPHTLFARCLFLLHTSYIPVPTFPHTFLLGSLSLLFAYVPCTLPHHHATVPFPSCSYWIHLPRRTPPPPPLLTTISRLSYHLPATACLHFYYYYYYYFHFHTTWNCSAKQVTGWTAACHYHHVPCCCVFLGGAPPPFLPAILPALLPATHAHLQWNTPALDHHRWDFWCLVTCLPACTVP